MSVYLEDKVEVLTGVGPSLAKAFKKLGVETIHDLLLYYPKKYDDYSNISVIAKLKPGKVTIRAKIIQVKGRWIRGGLHITEAVASDKSGSVALVWFNQPYREKSIKKNEQYYISGVLELARARFSIQNPSLELVSDFPVNTARIIPIYRQSKDVKSQQIRRALKQVFIAINTVESSLPKNIEKDYKLIDKHEALRLIHFPKSVDDLSRAKRRLGFEEVFELILASKLLKQETVRQLSVPIKFDKRLAQKFVKSLPFTLTNAQKVAAWEIFQDLEQETASNRLLEGDVGSGKTVVAAMAAVMAMNKNYQVAFMAPTEILARQHAETLAKLLEPLNYHKKIVLLVGSMKAPQKSRAKKHIGDGSAQLIIGTHALIQENVEMPNLALAIVDEQHRFGVDQRKELLKKAHKLPHMLSMTATPIPRSLALTVYGELDISILKDKPKNRQPIITKLIGSGQREKIYQQIDKLLADKQQMFVVCPLIEESDFAAHKSVAQVEKEIRKAFPKRKITALHGRQKPEDKQKIMQSFIDGKTDILVSTTVIEVGVDVPNATIMLIESPERFGLAQIHQLRGRVGRGQKQGYCYLMLDDGGSPTRRLRAAQQSSDGFKLAELDLQLRGPGAIYGHRQHGELDLRLVTLSDTELIKQANDAAKQAAQNPENLVQYPRLQARIKSLQKIKHLN